MNQPTSATPRSPGDAGHEEITLFSRMVAQQTSVALMLLGIIPHPESGTTIREIEDAKMLIDQLEMLEAKTKGNLTPDEDRLLKQSLTSLRMAFVSAVDAPPGRSASPPSASPSTATSTPEGSAQRESAAPASPASDEESRKKFSKKY